MGKLHEVISVEPSLKSLSDKTIDEAINTFIKKKDHFNGFIRSYKKLNDEALDLADQIKPVETTVNEKLNYVFSHLARSIDCLYQKEVANTLAKADLIVNGEIIATDLPATFLLNLEKKFTEVRSLCAAIPTLEPGSKWEKDLTEDNIYNSEIVETLKTEKKTVPLVLHPGTDKHPPIVDKITDDVVVGKWNTMKKSGAISPLEKSNKLSKIDNLIQSIKKARCRANDQEVESKVISDKLIHFIK